MKIKQTHGEDFFKNTGSLGGKAHHTTPRGFASMTPEQVSAAGRLGGSVSRKTKAKKEDK